MSNAQSKIVIGLMLVAVFILLGIATFFSIMNNASAASTYPVTYNACKDAPTGYDVRTPFFSYSTIVKKSGGCKTGDSPITLDVCLMTNPRTNWKAIKNNVDQVQVDRLANC